MEFRRGLFFFYFWGNMGYFFMGIVEVFYFFILVDYEEWYYFNLKNVRIFMGRRGSFRMFCIMRFWVFLFSLKG